MTADEMRDLAEVLTDRFTAIAGVRSIFPDSPVGAVALRLVRGTSPTVGRVRVDADEGPVVIAARLATERSVPTRTIIGAAIAAVDEVVGSVPYEIQLEFAVID